MAASVAASVVIVSLKRGPQAFSENRRRGAAGERLFVSRVWCYLLDCYMCVQPSHQRSGHLVINTTVVLDSCITFFFSPLGSATLSNKPAQKASA